MSAIRLAPGASIADHIRYEEEVVFVHQGTLIMTVDGQQVELTKGDNFSTPINAVRSFSNHGEQDAMAYITRRTNSPKKPSFI
ncbi:cupin domain-containing protein [Thalassotalea sp. Y01]|uniref:cupin domain-containing protein n=1 Tax=Thalassotalea sp. Y01 TaxID=2729613 RepID=UPI00145C7DCA|nr:cupin domain-containing protein [Thalassotalea sp. Y01]NMP16210.1 cupin domain-containing protein [Thalassotalea sp. Y01]